MATKKKPKPCPDCATLVEQVKALEARLAAMEATKAIQPFGQMPWWQPPYYSPPLRLPAPWESPFTLTWSHTSI
jgi:hypothetical protein